MSTTTLESRRRSTAPPLRSLRERQFALLVLCAASLMIILDSSVVNVALPTIQSDLDFAQGDLAWVVNAYVIPFGGLLLLAGRLGDLAGRKRVLLTGLVVFTLASLACGLATNSAMLIGARFVQGVGGALASAVALGMIATLFPRPREQGRAIGVYAFVAAAGASIGVLVGAVLTELLDWHWIFFINLPIGVATIALAARLIDEQKDDEQHGSDVTGGVLITGALTLTVYTVVQAVETGWTETRTLVLAAVAVALLAGFVLRESRAASPLVPLSLFRARNVAAANGVQVLLVGGLGGMFFFGALYLQQVLGFSVLEVGLAFLPVAVTIAVLSLKVTPRLINRSDARVVLIGGLVPVAAGLALFARVPADGTYWLDVLPAILLLGAGSGLCFPAVLTAAIADSTRSDAGARSGLVNTTQQIGSALGLAVLATVAADRTSSLAGSGTAPLVALTEGYQLAFLVAIGFAVAALLLSIVVLQPAVPRTAPHRLDTGPREARREEDLTGAVDPDLLALGIGGTGMMAMLWTVAAGRRAVGVDLRGDPSYGPMHWSIKEDLYHHLSLIDRMMMERYGEDRIPRRGDGSLFLLGSCFFSTETAAGDATADEVVSGFDLESHVGGVMRYVDTIDDRWRDGVPHRELTLLGAATPPRPPDEAFVGREAGEVLDSPPTFQVGAEELLILLRRYLEALERMDLRDGVEPRVRLFTHHRVVPAGRRGRSGFLEAGDGRRRVHIESIRELDHKGRFRWVREPGTEAIDLGVPELFVVAQGLDSADAAALGFAQHDVLVDPGDGRGPVPAAADYVGALIEVFIDSRLRRRVASEFDENGGEHWVHQFAAGHEDDSEIGWVVAQVPPHVHFDPVRAGLVSSRIDRKSAEWYAAHQLLLREYFLRETSLILNMPVDLLREIQLTYPARLFSLAERVGDDALLAANGVVAGDSFGNGHYITGGGATTGMVLHGSRVLRYWRERDEGVPAAEATRRLADRIKDDTMSWIDRSEVEFAQPPRPAGMTGPVVRRRRPRWGTSLDFLRGPEAHAHRHAHAERHGRRFGSPDHSEWRRLTIFAGRLHAFALPPLDERHPAEPAPAMPDGTMPDGTVPATIPAGGPAGGADTREPAEAGSR